MDITSEQYKQAEQEWWLERSKGNLDPFGEENDDINDLDGLGQLVWPARSGDKIAVYFDGEFYWAVADVHGPCGCKVLA